MGSAGVIGKGEYQASWGEWFPGAALAEACISEHTHGHTECPQQTRCLLNDNYSLSTDPKPHVPSQAFPFFRGRDWF